MSILDTIVVKDFKDYFYRDFPYLPIYNNEKTYFIDDVVYNNVNFYKSLIDNNTSALTDTTSWQVIKDDIYNYILDKDIEKAMSQAKVNAKVFGDDDEAKVIYLHLIAFYLCIDIANSSTGINSKYAGIVASKSVGDVSESYAIPEWMVKSPMYSMYAQNGYGLKYMSLIAPFLACTILFSNGYSTCD